jgi:hypothetical protein
MTTLEMIIAQIEALGEFASYYTRGSRVCVTIEDFEGYDEDWCEVDAELDEDAVDAFVEWLEEECDSHDGDYYHYYQFGDIEVELGYASMDI